MLPFLVNSINGIVQFGRHVNSIFRIGEKVDALYRVWYEAGMQKKPDAELIEKIRGAIQLRMAELGLSQAQLADEAGINRSALNELLKKSRLPGVSVLLKLANRLRVGVDFLLTGGQPPEFANLLSNAEMKEVLVLLSGLGEDERAAALHTFKGSLVQRQADHTKP